MNTKTLFFIFFFLSVFELKAQIKDFVKVDSFNFYLKNSKDKRHDLNLRLKYSLKSKKIAEELSINPLIIKSNLNTSDIYMQKGLNKSFLKLNHENLVLTKKINDSSTTALIYRNLGRFYEKSVSDSAYYYYYNAEKIYRSLRDYLNSSKLLLDIAIVQKNEKDFTASEVTSIEAIKLLESLEPSNTLNKRKAFLYNNLGSIFSELEQYEQSIKYHKKALEIKKNLNGNNKRTIDNSYNNIALIYKEYGKYELALEYYNRILENKNLINERPNVYSIVLDNYANTLYQINKKDEKLPDLYFESLRISDSIDSNEYYSIITYRHLAEYFLDKSLKDSAAFFANKAKEISKKYHNDELLRSLLLLSKIEEGDLALNHLRQYININDSLQKNERRTRNKFARIRFETQQIEQENKRIGKERMWLIIISIILAFSILLIYIIVTQRTKNRELEFSKKEQETNEEIYNLMLSQQDTIEEVRTLEKKRISKELHDGILGRLFGTRLSLDSLNMSSSREAMQTRGDYIVQLKNIEEDIRKVSHELSSDFVSGSGFTDIVTTLLETQMNAYKLSYKFVNDDAINWDIITNKYKIHIYRIIQETIHNIYKHAKAKNVSISFKWEKNVICLIISDDGVGFEVGKAKSGIGLKNMHSRIDEINGELLIASQKNKGTTVTVNVPVNYQ